MKLGRGEIEISTRRSHNIKEIQLYGKEDHFIEKFRSKVRKLPRIFILIIFY